MPLIACSFTPCSFSAARIVARRTFGFVPVVEIASSMSSPVSPSSSATATHPFLFSALTSPIFSRIASTALSGAQIRAACSWIIAGVTILAGIVTAEGKSPSSNVPMIFEDSWLSVPGSILAVLAIVDCNLEASDASGVVIWPCSLSAWVGGGEGLFSRDLLRSRPKCY
jgi:hypothetical protein